MPRKRAWDKHEIKAEINRRGHSLKSLSIRAGLNATDVSVALDRRFPKAERVIAAFLDFPIWELWPDRYDKEGLPIRYLKQSPIGSPISRAARNRINQARARRAELEGAA